MADAVSGREFFTTRTVARPSPASGPAADARPRRCRCARRWAGCPASPSPRPHPLPGFARSTVDGYAVRAADTYGASEGLPGYLDGHRRRAHGRRAGRGGHRRARAVTMPTGGVMPAGADAVVMVEYTAEAMPGTIEVVRPVAPGEGMVRADEDARPGDEIVPAGRPLRPQDLGMLAAAGVTSVTCTRRPRGDDLLHRRRGGAAGHARAARRPGTRRHAAALAALVTTRAASRSSAGSCPTTRARWRRPSAGAAGQRPHRHLRRLLGRHPRRDRERRRPRSASRASGATAWRSSRASRPCSPSAPACPSSGCRATRGRRSWCSG